MVPLYTPAQIRGLDKIAIEELHAPGILLMENAANNLRNIFCEIYPPNEFPEVAVLCGKGNNGGDGFALARLLLIEGYSVTVLCLFKKETFSPDALTQFELLTRLKKSCPRLDIRSYTTKRDLKTLLTADVFVDAILGSGASGSLTGPILEVVQFVNELPIPKFAVDLPTGLDAETGCAECSIDAEVTVTLGGLKQGLFFSEGYAFSGEVYEAGIGIPSEILQRQKTQTWLIEPEDVLQLLPGKPKNINKYSAGKVFTIAGSLTYPGAALLSSVAAFKVGTGASSLAFPKSLATMAHAHEEHQLIVRKYDDCELGYLRSENVDGLSVDINKVDVICLGPGLGREVETIVAIRKIIKNFEEKLFVLDADALFAIDWNSKRPVLPHLIVTPHLGEFAAMLNINTVLLRKDLLGYGRMFSKLFKCTLVLKDFRTLIFSPDGEVYIIPVGNSGLAKFGSGDVLSGVIAGLFAQTKEALSAVICGTYIHGLAADILKERKSIYGYTAADLLEIIPEAITFIEASCA